jgi:type I restriction enzyme M protein
MSCVLAQSGDELELKKELLKYHTLEAVFSMPDELFINSNVSTVTCIIVLKAHQPHPINYETYFGYCKDDGFIKRKPMGRGDYLNKWNGIKTQWLNGFRNKKVISGYSVRKYVNPEDEWCAEAYMETDYSVITEKDFIKSIKDFVIFDWVDRNDC